MARFPVVRMFQGALVATILVAASGQARATCMSQCELEFMFTDCTKPPSPSVWPSEVPLTLTGTCETCCSPPGGPLSCGPSDLTEGMLSLLANDQPAGGAFWMLEAGCGASAPLFQYDGTLEEGTSYSVVVEGLISLEFQVASGSCASDADCPFCTVCVGGTCKGLGVPICASDADCGAGETCKMDPSAPCTNHCISATNACASNLDCPTCWACMDGQCMASGLLECSKDSDCGAGEMCHIVPGAACKNSCVSGSATCVSDEDCGSCGLCLAGTCKAMGVVACTKDADCAAGETCHVVPTAQCENACIPGTSQCVTSDDCGACAGCVNGQCKGLGAILCTLDADCAAGETCKVDPTAPCLNQCVLATAECTTDEDCGACAVCVNSQCMGTGAVTCDQDSDCPGGETCSIDATDSCKNVCIAQNPACTTDDDCGSCSVCVGGECMGLGLVVCSDDTDCADGEACQVDPEDACKNQCVAAIATCTTDDDCGACSACVAGECKGTGAVMCTEDTECGDGETCAVDTDDPCKNHCVPSAAECTTNDDCGACAGCAAGHCVGLGAVICTADSDCPDNHTCQVDPQDECKNQCVEGSGDGDDTSPAGGDTTSSADGSGSAADTTGADGNAGGNGSAGSGGGSGGGCAAAPGAPGDLALMLSGLALLLLVVRRRREAR